MRMYKEFIELMAESKYSDSDYWVIFNEEKVPTGRVLIVEEGEGRDEGKVKIISDNLFNRFHADNIDVVDFWKTATDNFPFFSIAGSGDCKTPEQVNYITHSMAKNLGAIAVVDSFMKYHIEKDTNKMNMLEIGCGHGGFYNWFHQTYSEYGRYFGLDVVRLFDCDTLAIGDGYTIPDTLPAKFDFIYSINVFQHLSKKQRQSYFKEVSKKLTDDGIFVFGLYAEDLFNRDSETLWGAATENGDRLVHFLGQFTIAPTVSEIYEELGNVGLYECNLMTDGMNEAYLRATNYRSFIVMKPKEL